jgi:hypothetical protein
MCRSMNLAHEVQKAQSPSNTNVGVFSTAPSSPPTGAGCQPAAGGNEVPGEPAARNHAGRRLVVERRAGLRQPAASRPSGSEIL